MVVGDGELRRGLNRAAAEFLREMADLVETDDVYALDFQRQTKYAWTMLDRRDDDQPLEESWVIRIDVRRES